MVKHVTFLMINTAYIASTCVDVDVMASVGSECLLVALLTISSNWLAQTLYPGPNRATVMAPVSVLPCLTITIPLTWTCWSLPPISKTSTYLSQDAQLPSWISRIWKIGHSHQAHDGVFSSPLCHGSPGHVFCLYHSNPTSSHCHGHSMTCTQEYLSCQTGAPLRW